MKVVIYFVVCSFLTLISNVKLTNSNLNGKNLRIDLPQEHLPYYFNSVPELARECLQDENCPYKAHVNKNVCWGYEDNCGLQPNSYSHPICDEDHKGWVKSKDEQLQTFYSQADFGFIKNVRNSMTLLCQPTYREDSSLECSKEMTFCRGRNIMIDFRDLEGRSKPVMYDTDVLKAGQVGGFCKFLESNFKKTLGPIGSLQSWSPELQHFKELPSRPISPNSSYCDQIIKRPTIIMKIDATVSYYHHFCDFVNLYMSLHVNSTAKQYPFSTDVNILIWRTYDYKSNFESTFKAFTSHRLLSLNDFSGKRVCFENVVFPLLPRMIFGLYYNTPIIWGCKNSGLFHAFSNFILHRLRIERRQVPERKKIRVTFLSRKTTYRQVLNEDELIEELENHPELTVKKAEFTWTTPFTEQLQEIQNTDILIGMHGAGLTHMLFLPDWASVFELYNCDDEHCYKDLARLRGVHYITWEDDKRLQAVGQDPSKTGAHLKHTNYIFDRSEFIRLVQKAINHVKIEREKYIPSSGHDEL